MEGSKVYYHTNFKSIFEAVLCQSYFKLVFVGFVTRIGDDLKNMVYNQLFVPICSSKLQIQCIFGQNDISAFLTTRDGNKNTESFFKKIIFGDQGTN